MNRRKRQNNAMDLGYHNKPNRKQQEKGKIQKQKVLPKKQLGQQDVKKINEKISKKIPEHFIYKPNNYVEAGELGSGAFGKTYKVINEEDGQTYVIKKLKKKNAIDREMFEDEVKILERLKTRCKSHLLCYVGMYDSNDSEYYTIITEDLSDYIPLDKYIENTINVNGPGDPKNGESNIKNKNIRTIFTNLIIGLQTLHDADVAHRDIKPANIMLHKNTGDVKFIDFGISCWKDECETADLGGTEIYLSPELKSIFKNPNVLNYRKLESSIDFYKKTDYYALGITLLQYLVGIDMILQVLHQTDDPLKRNVLFQNILRQLIKEYGVEYLDIVNVIDNLIQIDPNKRHLPTLTFQTTSNLSFIDNAKSNLNLDHHPKRKLQQFSTDDLYMVEDPFDTYRYEYDNEF